MTACSLLSLLRVSDFILPRLLRRPLAVTVPFVGIDLFYGGHGNTTGAGSYALSTSELVLLTSTLGNETLAQPFASAFRNAFSLAELGWLLLPWPRLLARPNAAVVSSSGVSRSLTRSPSTTRQLTLHAMWSFNASVQLHAGQEKGAQVGGRFA